MNLRQLSSIPWFLGRFYSLKLSGLYGCTKINTSSKLEVDNNVHSHCIKKGAEFFAIATNYSSKPLRTQIQVKWNKPMTGWVKLSTDGSALGSSGNARGGGIPCDSSGDWASGFAS